jgi:hypothetical protein
LRAIGESFAQGRDDAGQGPVSGVITIPLERPNEPPAWRRMFTGFDRERATYERLKPELLKTAEGKFVVIVGDVSSGPFGSHEDAERAGYAQFGLGPLYIKQVLAEEPVAEVTRLVAP